jgi:hypothetical protein
VQKVAVLQVQVVAHFMALVELLIILMAQVMLLADTGVVVVAVLD